MSHHKNTNLRCPVLLVIAILVISSTSSVQAQVPKPPSSRADNVREVVHGVEIIDPYRWLEDQDAPETRAWIDAQNKYTHSLLDALPARPMIQKRLSELLRVDSVSTPFEQSGRYFLFKKRAEDDLSILYVRQGLNGKDEVLIDPHTLSTDHTTDIGLLDVSNDGKLVIYSVRRGGQDETELRVMDVDKRKDLEQLPNALYRGVSMKKDGSGFYYNLQLITNGSIPRRTRSLMQYALEIKDPYLGQLVRRVEAGEMTIDHVHLE